MNVGIIGSGTMGIGIAQVFAENAKYNVLLCDSSEELANRGKAAIAKKLQALVKKNRLSDETAAAILSRIRCGLCDSCFDCDLIIEAVPENVSIKRDVFRGLDKIAKPECVFASNTSSLSITEIGAGLTHFVVGMHFFNPAERMKLVEIIPGENTPDSCTEFIKNIAVDIGKTPVCAQESPGFVVNRLLIPMINEAVCVYADGIASAHDIDTAMQLGASHPMGPLALGDLIGWDVVLAIMEVLQCETGDQKYRPHPLLRKMVRAGKLGKKAGIGFYQYTD